MAVCRADSFECTTTAGCRLLFPPSIKGCVKLCRRCISKTRSSSSYLHGLTTQALLSVLFYFSFRPAFQEVGGKKLMIVCICSWKQEKLKALKQTDNLPNVNFKCSQKERAGGLGGTIWTWELWTTYHLMMVMGVGNVGFLKKCTQSRLYFLKKKQIHKPTVRTRGHNSKGKVKSEGRKKQFFYRDILAWPITVPPLPIFLKH